MTLFPSLGESFYVDNDIGILKRMDVEYAKYITVNQTFWSQADLDNRFCMGDQTAYADLTYGNLPIIRKKNFSFNRIRRVVNMITGFQRQHRKSTICEPAVPEASNSADHFTKLLFHVNNHAGVLETLSEAFEGALISGMNLLSCYMDYSKDPINGDLCVDNVSYN